MKQQERKSIPERLGRWAGRAWRGYARREAGMLQWLQLKGVPVLLTKTVLWAVKLTVLGVLLYAVFWLTLIALFAIAGAWTLRNAPPPEAGEWRRGDQGYGFYEDGVRTDYGRLFEQEKEDQ
jgi:hypothetical protein